MVTKEPTSPPPNRGRAAAPSSSVRGRVSHRHRRTAARGSRRRRTQRRQLRLTSPPRRPRGPRMLWFARRS
jgi:hypothetical protein